MRSTVISFAVVVLLLWTVPGLVDSASAASLLVEAKPNPGVAGQQITVTISAGDEGIKYLYGPCDLMVNFGDGSKPQNAGKLTSQPGGLLTKSITHSYPFLKFDKIYTITVSPLNCDAAKYTANTVKTTVKILVPRVKPSPLP